MRPKVKSKPKKKKQNLKVFLGVIDEETAILYSFNFTGKDSLTIEEPRINWELKWPVQWKKATIDLHITAKAKNYWKATFFDEPKDEIRKMLLEELAKYIKHGTKIFEKERKREMERSYDFD